MSESPMATTASEPSASTVRFDVVAGLTAAAVVLPKAMAYATVAGLPVAVGLYTAFVPMVLYALLGSSRVQRQFDDHARHPGWHSARAGGLGRTSHHTGEPPPRAGVAPPTHAPARGVLIKVLKWF